MSIKTRRVTMAVMWFLSCGGLPGQIGDPGGGGGGGGQPPVWDIITPVPGADLPSDVDIPIEGTAPGADMSCSLHLRRRDVNGPQGLLGGATATSTATLDWATTMDCEGGFGVPWCDEWICDLDLYDGLSLEDTHNLKLHGDCPL
jgi:hypothetical protein